MLDLYFAGLILAAISAGLFFGMRRLVERRPVWVSIYVVGAVVVLVCLFGWFVHGKLLVATVLPFSNAIILGNGIALGMTALAGVMAGQSNMARWRRWPFTAVQSCAASCSPASAATLLRYHGIAATEQEMIGLCLTTELGTPSLGLYRGLKLKTQETAWRVEIVRGTADELFKSRAGPVLLRIRLDTTDSSSDGRWPWSPGIGHAVVFYSLGSGGSVEIGDPAVGRDRWTTQDLRSRWRGEGLRLVRRSGQ
ncbi:MAG: hypothetical protein K8T91_22180 [Planctomycetes bacterium]|nr:hypothetical protein [Planctomycetota bacterium]